MGRQGLLNRWMRSAPLPPPGTLRPIGRARIFIEVIVAYLPLLRTLSSNDLRRLAAEARTPQRRRISIPAEDQARTARRLGFLVMRCLAPLPTDKRCLIRSLVTLRMLEHRSLSGQLVIGVSHDGAFSAHAWVEFEGLPILPQAGHSRLIDL